VPGSGDSIAVDRRATVVHAGPHHRTRLPAYTAPHGRPTGSPVVPTCRHDHVHKTRRTGTRCVGPQVVAWADRRC